MTEHQKILASMSDPQLKSLYQCAVGTGYEDPGADCVNGFTIDELAEEVNNRRLRVRDFYYFDKIDYPLF